MKPTLGFPLCAISVLLFACSHDPAKEPKDSFVAGAWLAPHGMDGYLSKQGERQMGYIHDLGFSWVAYAPEPTMVDPLKPEITDNTSAIEHRRIIRRLQANKLKVLLFPRIESPTFFRAKNPLWRGDIKMSSPSDWDQFHENLAQMLEGYATLAESEGVALFCLGLEYRHSTTAFPEQWRKIIARVRKRFSGKIVYSANWYQEYEQVKFWSALDYIGVGAYFPVAKAPSATRQQMRQAWLPIVAKLRGLSQQYDRKILFAEVGYPALDQAGWKPWEWTTAAGKKTAPAHQADCFRSFFDAIQDQDWFRGFFIWRYHTDTRYIKDWEYSPQGRPAEKVIKAWLTQQHQNK